MTIQITALPLQPSLLDSTFIPVEISNVTGRVAATAIKTYVGTIFSSLTATGTITAGADVTITGNLIQSSTGYHTIPSGNTAQRPTSPAAGMIRYNSTISSYEGYGAGNAWSSLGGVKSVDGKAYIIAETSPGAGDDVVRVYAGDSGTSTQVLWASTSNVKIIPTTASTSATSGALQVAGGTGISGNLYVGGTVGITGTSSYTGAATFSSTIGVTGAATLSSTLGVTGATTLAALTATSITIPAITKNGTSNSGDIGQSNNVFNTVYATTFNGVSTTAKYADLAENYTSDNLYPAGTVVIFGTDAEVTISTQENDIKVAGVISTNPAHLMNGDTPGVPVALTGRVPCRVTGDVRRGDLMVTSSIPGTAKSNNNPPIGAVIGKALGNHTGSDIGIIEVVVGRV